MSTAGEPGPRRPSYLLLALVVTLLFGAGAWLEGCSTIGFYRGETLDTSVLTAGVTDDADRGKVDQLAARYVEVRDAARPRALPLGVASFLLGAALLLFGTRAMSRRPGARSLLLQLVTAQAALAMLAYALTRDIRFAELDLSLAVQVAKMRDKTPDAAALDEATRISRAVWAVLSPGWLVGRTIVSALVLVALTRRRSVEWLDTQAEPLVPSE